MRVGGAASRTAPTGRPDGVNQKVGYPDARECTPAFGVCSAFQCVCCVVPRIVSAGGLESPSSGGSGFCPIAGADDLADDRERIRRGLHAFALFGTPKTVVGLSRGATCEACGPSLSPTVTRCGWRATVGITLVYDRNRRSRSSSHNAWHAAWNRGTARSSSYSSSYSACEL